jgi:hypothetical protein
MPGGWVECATYETSKVLFMRDPKKTTYVGIHNDEYGGMTFLGGIIKDGWIFGLIPETETGEGWAPGQLEVLSEKVRERWSEFEYSVSRLPPEIRARHERIHAQAITRARELGWDPLEDDDE